MGESYCYKFMEETQLNEVVKMGCSSFFCNVTCAIPNQLPPQNPGKLGDFPVEGQDIVIPNRKPTDNTTSNSTAPVANSVEESAGTPDGNSNSRYQITTIFTAVLTLVFCKMI
uniref:ZP domain-containing protein n=1 Tax=Caenorhabditis tropicalis TaxID=1561998 RepID=A0A1I7U1H4_9PELO